MKKLVAQSCPTLCNPMDCSPPGSSDHGILQARILEWVAIPLPGNLPNPGIEPGSYALQADSLVSEPPGKPSSHEIRLQNIFSDNRFILKVTCQKESQAGEFMRSRLMIVDKGHSKSEIEKKVPPSLIENRKSSKRLPKCLIRFICPFSPILQRRMSV